MLGLKEEGAEALPLHHLQTGDSESTECDSARECVHDSARVACVLKVYRVRLCARDFDCDCEFESVSEILKGVCGLEIAPANTVASSHPTPPRPTPPFSNYAKLCDTSRNPRPTLNSPGRGGPPN